MEEHRGLGLAQLLTILRAPKGAAITQFQTSRLSTGPSQGHQQWASGGCSMWTEGVAGLWHDSWVG